MEKYISVNKESMEKLRRIFGIGGKPLCERTVKNALNFESDSELAKKIRYTAQTNFYGVLYTVCEAMECFFTSDNDMVCIFPNGAELRCDRTTGESRIYMKGKVVRRWENTMFSQIQMMQETAAAL